jgi:hypothetical protein
MRGDIVQDNVVDASGAPASSCEGDEEGRNGTGALR